MSELIQEPRHFCALGAQKTVIAIERAIPIVHAGPGCSAKLTTAMSSCGGQQGSGYAGGDAIPCSNLVEKDVVFGGEKKLRRLIEGTLKVMDGDFFVVLTGCISDIVGDDVGSVVKEFQENGVPIIYAETGGFKGDAYKGHELVLEAIIKQYLKPTSQKKSGLVNVFASVPNHDPFWEGDLNEIKELLGSIGLKANILFGHNTGGINAINDIPNAEFNLVISPWIGVNVAEILKEKYNTPYLHYPVLPIGGVETSKFLVNDLGLLPVHQFITEDVPEKFKNTIRQYFKDFPLGISSDVTFSQDGWDINEKIAKYHINTMPLILGSSWDMDIADDMNGLHLSVALPISDRLILNHTYVGYRGGLNLTEDIYSKLLSKHN